MQRHPATQHAAMLATPATGAQARPGARHVGATAQPLSGGRQGGPAARPGWTPGRPCLSARALPPCQCLPRPNRRRHPLASRVGLRGGGSMARARFAALICHVPCKPPLTPSLAFGSFSRSPLSSSRCRSPQIGSRLAAARLARPASRRWHSSPSARPVPRPFLVPSGLRPHRNRSPGGSLPRAVRGSTALSLVKPLSVHSASGGPPEARRSG